MRDADGAIVFCPSASVKTPWGPYFYGGHENEDDPDSYASGPTRSPRPMFED